jgi:hypothetical protein
MKDSIEPPKIFLVDAVTIEGLFGLFSIFFISTISLFFAIVLMLPSYEGFQYQQNLIFISISVFLVGYTTILAAILIYYIIRFSKFFNALYQNHKRGFVIVTLLIVIIVPSIIASIYTTSPDFTNRAIAYSVLAIMAIILIMMQNVLVEMAEPLTSKILKIVSTNRTLKKEETKKED